MDARFGNSSILFSVCVDSTNRGLELLDTLEGIRSQSYSDFEVIIVDKSPDVSRDFILEYLNSISDSRFKFFRQEPYLKTEIECWNAPILRAEGQYIVICEGDDIFAPCYLEAAAKEISIEGRGGCFLYANQSSDRSVVLEPCGNTPAVVSDASSLLSGLFALDWCPAPSLTIFPRLTPEGVERLYSLDYVWAAEYELYWRLLSEGSVPINIVCTKVYRGPSFYPKTSFHLRDAERFLQKVSKEQGRGRIGAGLKRLSNWGANYFAQSVFSKYTDWPALSAALRHGKLHGLVQVAREIAIQVLLSLRKKNTHL